MLKAAGGLALAGAAGGLTAAVTAAAADAARDILNAWSEMMRGVFHPLDDQFLTGHNDACILPRTRAPRTARLTAGRSSSEAGHPEAPQLLQLQPPLGPWMTGAPH
ncbi:hypothetical protein [Streptomyces sparsogenes]|uniref:Secreted protein n=1 Tax=Streptomyces sparsogenes DSM 40356 TaxID=1331668 RepID=A0A1R1SCP1_9ACTN|nr:hypothetical protein [Streptomyces sparsogenes]OMI36026.1 hypothetical protein SPAR_28276 [Streptomyces sparsogenes DSM 40356]